MGLCLPAYGVKSRESTRRRMPYSRKRQPMVGHSHFKGRQTLTTRRELLQLGALLAAGSSVRSLAVEAPPSCTLRTSAPRDWEPMRSQTTAAQESHARPPCMGNSGRDGCLFRIPWRTSQPAPPRCPGAKIEGGHRGGHFVLAFVVRHMSVNDPNFGPTGHRLRAVGAADRSVRVPASRG